MCISRKNSNFALVIELERHIEILLLSNDCVIVPDLGGFMTHHVDARYDESDCMFLPPLRTLGFNPQLRLNDHLLVQSYIEAYDISYPEALRRIEEEVAELKQHIESAGEYELNGIGLLRLNEEGHYEFEPCEAGILTPDYYGLSTFEMQLVSKLREDSASEEETETVTNAKQKEEAATRVVPMSDEQPESEQTDDEQAIVIRMSWLRHVAAVAAAVLAFFIIGTPVSNSDIVIEQSSIMPIVGNSETVENISHSNAEIVIDNAQTRAAAASEIAREKSKNTETLAKPAAETKSFTIVLASQTSRHLAEDFIGRMNQKGFSGIKIMEMDNSSKVRVVYHSFASLESAHDSLRSLRGSDEAFREAWVLEIKK